MKRIITCAITVLMVLAFAPPAAADDAKRDEARQLIAHARNRTALEQLPPYHLIAKVRFFKLSSGHDQEGAIDRRWVAKDRSRTEIIVADYSEVVIRQGSTSFVKRPTQYEPDRVGQVLELLGGMAPQELADTVKVTKV